MLERKIRNFVKDLKEEKLITVIKKTLQFEEIEYLNKQEVIDYILLEIENIEYKNLKLIISNFTLKIKDKNNNIEFNFIIM